MSLPAARDTHEIVVSADQADAAQRLLGVPVHAGDRVRFEVVEGGMSSSVPRPRGRREAPDGGRPSRERQKWLQDLDADEAVDPDVPAAVELAQARERGEV